MISISESVKYNLIKFLKLSSIEEIERFLKDENRVKSELEKYNQIISEKLKQELEEKIRNGECIERENLFNWNLEEFIVTPNVLRGRAPSYDKIIEDFQGANFKKADLYAFPVKELNLESADLSEVNFSHLPSSCATFPFGFPNFNLKDAKLSGANLCAITFSDSNLEGADLYGANLSLARMKKSNLSKANLTKAFLPNALLEEIDFSEANFNEAYLTEAKIVHSNCSKTDFNGAFLSRINFDNNNCNEANFSGAKITSIRQGNDNNSNFNGEFINSNFKKVKIFHTIIRGNFKNSDFSGAVIVSSTLFNVDFSDAKFIGAELKDSTINTRIGNFGYRNLFAKFFMTDFTGANMESIICNNVDFSGANLSNTNLANSSLSGNFSKSNFSNANLEWSEITSIPETTKTNFSGANLQYANIRGNFSMANFCNANLIFVNERFRNTTSKLPFDEIFKNTNLKGANFAGAKVKEELKQAVFKQDVEGYDEIQWV